MSRPKISIVTPSFMQGEFLEQTIDSVLSQGYPELEYFVVDGGSTDGSLEIIKKYEKHLIWWVSEPDKGQSHAINKGLERATGDIINWINSDDYYEPNALKTVAEAFSDPSVKMATFRASVFGLENRVSRGTDIFQGNLPKTLAYSRIDQPETFFRKSCIDRMGPLNESLHYCMDKEWFMRFLLLFGIDGVHRSEGIILNFRYHEASKSVSKADRFAEEADMIYSSLAEDSSPEDIKKGLDLLRRSHHGAPSYIPQTLDHDTDVTVIDEALNYYLFKRFLEKYEDLDLGLCRQLVPLIERNTLNKGDARYFSKIAKRSRFLPSKLIELGRIFSR